MNEQINKYAGILEYWDAGIRANAEMNGENYVIRTQTTIYF